MIRQNDCLDLFLYLNRLFLGSLCLVRILTASSGLDTVVCVKPVVLLIPVLPVSAAAGILSACGRAFTVLVISALGRAVSALSSLSGRSTRPGSRSRGLFWRKCAALLSLRALRASGTVLLIRTSSFRRSLLTALCAPVTRLRAACRRCLRRTRSSGRCTLLGIPGGRSRGALFPRGRGRRSPLDASCAGCCRCRALHRLRSCRRLIHGRRLGCRSRTPDGAGRRSGCGRMLRSFRHLTLYGRPASMLRALRSSGHACCGRLSRAKRPGIGIRHAAGRVSRTSPDRSARGVCHRSSASLLRLLGRHSGDHTAACILTAKDRNELLFLRRALFTGRCLGGRILPRGRSLCGSRSWSLCGSRSRSLCGSRSRRFRSGRSRCRC